MGEGVRVCLRAFVKHAKLLHNNGADFRGFAVVVLMVVVLLPLLLFLKSHRHKVVFALTEWSPPGF